MSVLALGFAFEQSRQFLIVPSRPPKSSFGLWQLAVL